MILESSHAMLWALWLVSHTCSAKADFKLLKLETAIWCSSFRRVQNWRFVWPRYTFSQSPHGIEYTPCVFWSVGTRSLGFAKMCPNVWKGFRATLIPQLLRTLLIGSAITWMFVTFTRIYTMAAYSISRTFSKLFLLGLLHTIPTPVFLLHSNYFSLDLPNLMWKM